MKHRIFAALLFFTAGIIFFLAVLFPSVPKEESSAPLKRYLFIVPTDAVTQNILLKEGIAAACEERNVYVRFLEISSFNEQKEEVDKALYSGFDGIILCPMDNGSEGLWLLDTIQENQLELVTIFNDICSDYPCLSSAQNMGEQAAAALLSQVEMPEDIYILNGNSQNIIYQNRAAAFTAYLAQYNISVADTLSLNIDMVSSGDQVKKYISKNHIQYLFCTDAASTASAARCLDSFLLAPPMLIGCDYVETTESYFNPDFISSLFCTEYYDTGRCAVLLLDDLVSKKTATEEEYQALLRSYYDETAPHHTQAD